jgi:hypothetical protein
VIIGPGFNRPGPPFQTAANGRFFIEYKKMTGPRAKSTKSEKMAVGQLAPLELPESGDANRKIEPVDGPAAMDQAEALAFMEEPVKVMVHTSADQNAEPIVQTGVNGRTQFFIRGQSQVVRRKFVEALARAKHTAYTQRTEHDYQTGNVIQKMIPRTSLRYPFSVEQDDNPKGADWLRKVLAEG